MSGVLKYVLAAISPMREASQMCACRIIIGGFGLKDEG